MDTVTQALLGGAVGYVIAGKQSPRKAMLYGAAIAILPDLDVFIAYEDDLSAVTMHRSWTHSWFVQTLVAPLFAFVLHSIVQKISYKRWCLLVWLSLVTHSGLDALTVYGTQLFWPLMPPPVSGGSIFIIDPIYSIPLLTGFLAVLIIPHAKLSKRWMLSTFIFSCCYLVWGLTLQQWITQQAKNTLVREGISHQHLLVTATPLNTLLWRVLVIDGEYYYEGFRSLFDGADALPLARYSRHQHLINQVKSVPAIHRVDWFTHGFYAVNQHRNRIVATDLRMGLEPIYFFRYNIAQLSASGIKPLLPMRVESERRTSAALRWVWDRIWNPEAQFNSDATELYSKP